MKKPLLMATDIKNDSDKNQNLRRRINRWGTVFRQFPKVIHLVWEAWPLGTIILPVLTIIVGVLPALPLYFIKMIVDGMAVWLAGDKAAGQQTVFLFVSLNIVVFLLQNGLEPLIQFVETVMESRLRFHIQNRVMQRSIELDMSFFETPSFYDKLQRAQREVG